MARFIRVFAFLALAASIPACTSFCTRFCAPLALTKTGALIDLDAAPNAHAPTSAALVEEVAAQFRSRSARHPNARPYNFLGLSSGGLYAAYGIGVLKGWSDSGQRPPFDAVTGISSGALMATFAFLGPQYDGLLRDNLVGIQRRDFLRLRFLPAVPALGSIFSSLPFKKRVEDVITPEILAEVARAHAAGRRLYIGTTNLDTRRLVIWDMGAIASRGNTEALTLYRDIVLASASVPGAVLPVRLQVEIDGVMYEELHADGGTSDELIFRTFIVGDLNRTLGLPGDQAPAGSKLWLLSNGKLYTDPACVHGLFSMLSASSATLISNKSRDELYRVFLNCLETGVEMRLTAVPEDLPVAKGILSLTPEEQETLYKAGYQAGLQAASGQGWRTLPPGIDPSEQSLPRSGTRFATKANAQQKMAPH